MAQRRAAGCSGGQEERRVVAGVDVDEPAGRAVELAVEQRDEAVRGDVRAQVGVEPRHELLAAQARGEERAEAALEERHEESGRHALARHVADRDGEAPLAELDDVEVVASHRVRRAHRAHDRDPVLLEGLERQQAELDLARHLEVALQRELVAQLESEEEEERGRGEEGPGLEAEDRVEGERPHAHQVAEEPEPAEDEGDRGGGEEDAPPGAEAERHRQEEPPEGAGVALVPRQPGEVGHVHLAGEEAEGLVRLVLHQLAQALRRDVAGEEVAQRLPVALGQGGRPRLALARAEAGGEVLEPLARLLGEQ